MKRNYFIIALRNISKRGLFSVLNIAGLATGIACSILILMWVDHELSYDRFHPDYKNIQRIAFRMYMSGESIEGPVAMAPLAAALTETFPEVEDVVRIHKQENVNLGVGTDHYIEPLLLMADSSFFTFFGFDLETGEPETVLKTPFSIVITREVAEKFFGNRNPVGETIRLNNAHDYTVTGVAANPPSNSHISFGAVSSFLTMYEIRPGTMDGWKSLSYFTYIKFNRHFDADRFFARLDDLLADRLGADSKEFGVRFDPFLQPVSSVYLNSNTRFELTPSGNKASVYIFLAVSVFILMLACINFMNLSTARSSLRSKEVGVRKFSGATRGNLVSQFLGESVVYSLIAGLLAIPLIELGLPHFNNITSLNLDFFSAGNYRILTAFPVFILAVGLIAGSYPAVVLSAGNPLKTIKGEKVVSSGRSRLRSGLIIFQIIISITLVICTIFVWKQLNYINSKNLGFDKSNKIIVRLNTGELRGRYDIIRKELLNVPGVRDIAVSNSFPGIEFSGTGYKPEGFDEEIIGTYINTDHKYLEVMDIRIVEGRNFDPAFPSDTMAVLVNETAVRSFGWEDALERTIDCRRTGDVENFRVIGVVGDFHFRSMHKEVEPLIIHLLKGFPGYLTIDIDPVNFHHTLAGIKSGWEEINPDDPFELRMLSDTYDNHYKSERQLSRIFTFFSIMAFLIAALGIYGLSSFMVENKTKEIGIRKAFGAPVYAIITDFFRQFAGWLLAANIISWALAWYLMDKWLDIFAYKITLGNPRVFLGAALISAFVVMVAAGYQSLKAANLDPAESMRHE